MRHARWVALPAGVGAVGLATAGLLVVGADDAAAAYVDGHRWLASVTSGDAARASVPAAGAGRPEDGGPAELPRSPDSPAAPGAAAPAVPAPVVTTSPPPAPDALVLGDAPAIQGSPAPQTAVVTPAPDRRPDPAASPPAGPQQPATPLTGLAAPGARPTPPAPAEPAPPVRPAPAGAPFTPVRLVVPALAIDGPVTDVGVTEDREFAVPEDPGLVGRWDGGARPGEGRGTIAMAGHVTWRGVDGLLHRLDELVPGDEVWLLAADGTGAVYVAGSVELHSKQALPWQDMFRDDVAERLLLITCGGSVDPVTGIHDSNVVAHLTPAPR